MEANHLGIYKRGRGSELGVTVKQIQVVVRAGLKPRTTDCSVTLPPCLNVNLLFVALPQSWIEKILHDIREIKNKSVRISSGKFMH